MKYRIITCIVILTGLVSPPCYSQITESQDELLADGHFFFQEEDYQEAIYYFLKLEGTPYMNANIMYKIGVCYLNIPGQEHQAVPYLEKAAENISPSYKVRSATEERAPLHTLFYLGRAYRISNQLEKALEAFTAFKEVPRFDRLYNLAMVDNEIRACGKAKIIGDIPVPVEIVNLNEPVNTEVDNYNPVLSGDQNIMVYMTDQKFYDAIFMVERKNGLWLDPVNITPQVESDGDAYPTCLSPDGKTLYLVRGSRNNRDIYVSSFIDGFWTKMMPLNENINSSRAESHASISPDGKTLYFTSNRRGGYGEMDIYLSRQDNSGQWGTAVNLGPVINTPYNEETPFLAEDGITLFFSSEGHYNMGGYDIFCSTMENDRWTDPINIGFPVNTTGDNLFFFPVNNGKSGYITAILPEGLGGKDIYYINILEGNVMQGTGSSGTFKGPEAAGAHTIFVTDEKTGEKLVKIVYDRNRNEFRYERLKPGYTIKVEKAEQE